MIKISVIIPVFNVEKYLQECIDSLLNQTCEEIEYIFVNDASTDSSLNILLENLKRAPDVIRIIDSKENLRQGGARNLGIMEANGEYIGFVDSDDIVSPDMFETLYHAVSDGIDAAFIQYAAIPEDMALERALSDCGRGLLHPIVVWNQKLLDTDNKTLTEENIADMLAYPIGGVYCGIWRRSLIVENKVRFPEHLAYEDNYWTSLVKCYLRRVKYIKEIKYFYRRNPASTTSARNQDYQYDRITIENQLLREVKKRNLLDCYYDAWEYVYTYRYAFNSYWLFVSKFDRIRYDLLTKIIRDLKAEFPLWSRNHYYKALTPKKRRLRNRIISVFPGIYGFTFHSCNLLKNTIFKSHFGF